MPSWLARPFAKAAARSQPASAGALGEGPAGGPRTSSYVTPKMLGAAVAFLGATFLVSWYVDSLRDLSAQRAETAMNYNTALGFVAAGLAVVSHCFGRRRFAFWGGALAAGLGSLSLAENVLGRSLHVIRSLFGGAFVLPELQPMSPITALGFALTGCLLICWRAPRSTQRWRRVAIGTLASSIVAAGFVGLLAFVLHDGSQYGWARLTRMEAHTALGFVGLGTAFFLMLTRLREAPESVGLPGWAAWTVSLGVIALTLTLWTSLTTTDARLNAVAAMRSHEAALAHTSQALQSHLRALQRVAASTGPVARDSRALRELLVRETVPMLHEQPGVSGVAWISPAGGVEWAHGDGVAAELEELLRARPDLRSSLRTAREERLVAVSDPATLFGRHESFYVALPGALAGPPEAAAAAGVLLVEHRVQPFFDWLLGDGVGRAFDVELTTAEGRPFFESHSRRANSRRLDRASDARLTTGQVAFGDKVWTIAGQADGSWFAAGKSAGNTLILWFGLFLAIALGIVIRKSELVRQRAASLAEANRTIERNAASLEQANVSLESQAMHLRATEAQLIRAAREKRRVLDSLSALLIGVDESGRIVEWNSVGMALFGLGDAQTLGRRFEILPLSWDREQVACAVSECLASGERVRRDGLLVTLPGGATRVVSITVSPTQAGEGRGFSIIGADVTERQQLEMQLHHAQRLEAVGTLAAGIAHEINTPMQYVGDNLRFVSDSMGPLAGLLRLMPEVVEAAHVGHVEPALAARLQAAAEACDLDFLLDQLPAALGETQEGVQRVTTIVRAMKDFSHPGGHGRASADLNRALETTLAVARNEYKYVADIETDFGDLPPVECHLADLNQVFLNLLVNAAHAIRDKVGDSGERGLIRIVTRVDGDSLEVRVEDTGGGIPEWARPKVFEQFFTTKEVGKGTGLGLSIAHAVVVDKHGGSIRFETQTGRGTSFIVRIPLSPPRERELDRSEARA